MKKKRMNTIAKNMKAFREHIHFYAPSEILEEGIDAFTLNTTQCVMGIIISQ